jgi:N-acetylglucosaminyl-diphospho-decaprenol L-rhamnosyltransferase
MSHRQNRLAVIIVSANSAGWLRPCLTTVYQRAGDVELDVVVVAAGCTDETVPLVEREFPQARTISCDNRGFAYANNCALRTVDADWILLLNPDTEILDGSFGDVIARLGSRPTVGLVGVRQVTSDGQLFPTIRRFPNAIRSLFEAVGSERFPFRASWLGERELDLRAYEQDVACDWTSGSFMLLRREALQSAGFMDERFFLYCEETDLCLRIKQAGWEIRHLPYLTILHHANKEGWNPRLDAQAAYAKRQYFKKHLSPLQRLTATAALFLGYTLRSAIERGDPGRRASSRAALSTLLGLSPPPFGEPPRVAVGRERDGEGFLGPS